MVFYLVSHFTLSALGWSPRAKDDTLCVISKCDASQRFLSHCLTGEEVGTGMGWLFLSAWLAPSRGSGLASLLVCKGHTTGQQRGLGRRTSWRKVASAILSLRLDLATPSLLSRQRAQPSWVDGQDRGVVSPLFKSPLHTLGFGCTHHQLPGTTCLCQGGKKFLTGCSLAFNLVP